jgi:hypothetical protein
MSEKPVLDYEPRPPVPTRRQKVASVALIVSCTLAVPDIFAVANILVMHYRYRLFDSGFANQCADVALACNGIGLVLAILAFAFGRDIAGLAILFHIICLLLLPTFGIA